MTNLTHPKILIIDDEPDLLETLKDQAELMGFAPTLANDGLHALEILQATAADSPFDAILSDIKMPRLNGLDFLARVRGAGVQAPVVFLTGFADREIAASAKRLGAFDLLEKPIQLEQLARALRSAVALGISMRSIESEVDEMATRFSIPQGQLAGFRESQRAILLLKKEAAARKQASVT